MLQLNLLQLLDFEILHLVNLLDGRVPADERDPSDDPLSPDSEFELPLPSSVLFLSVLVPFGEKALLVFVVLSLDVFLLLHYVLELEVVDAHVNGFVG